jgi:hypothetical protein
MNDESTLRAQTRKLIQSGSLPARRPDGMWGGPGAGEPCCICGAVVTPEDIEMEVEFARVDGRRADVYHFHNRCFAAWELERQALEAAATSASGDGAAESRNFCAAESVSPAFLSDTFAERKIRAHEFGTDGQPG